MGQDIVALVVRLESAKESKRRVDKVCTEVRECDIVWTNILRRLSHGQ